MKFARGEAGDGGNLSLSFRGLVFSGCCHETISGFAGDPSARSSNAGLYHDGMDAAPPVVEAQPTARDGGR